MNFFGHTFRVELFGESHGPAIGVIIDGCPPGIPFTAEDLEPDMARRRAQAAGTTPRHESDIPEIVAGVYKGVTTGAPICALLRNEDTRSEDYSAFVAQPRPGHADFTSRIKYRGFNDPRGSGHFSGRITAGLVVAGVCAKKILRDIKFTTRLLAIAGTPVKSEEEITRIAAACAEKGDSAGALVELQVDGLPAGLGEPFFDAAESLIAHAIFSVPAVRALEFGDGFRAASMYGSEHNDPILDTAGHTAKNGAGGINGGISNGNQLLLRVAVKPASSIGLPQHTFDFSQGKMGILKVEGRHDACIALRAAVVLEAACAIALADLYIRSGHYIAY